MNDKVLMWGFVHEPTSRNQNTCPSTIYNNNRCFSFHARRELCWQYNLLDFDKLRVVQLGSYTIVVVQNIQIDKLT